MKKAKFMSFVCSMLFIGILFAAAIFFEPATGGATTFLLGSCGCSLVSPRQNPNTVENPFPSISEEPRLIALTFDDGPSVYTLQLLDALGKRDAFATFFTAGEAVNVYPTIANRIVAEGHEIACHAYSHPFLATLSADEIRMELTKSRNAIYSATGTVPAILRPPYGNFNSQVQSVAMEFDMPLILWNVDTIDWRDRDVEVILGRIINPRGFPLVQSGDIILMHDTLSTTVDAAIKIVYKLQEHGFQFVTVSQLFDAKDVQLIPGAVYGCAR